MSREYIQVFYSFLDEYSGLTDEQFGCLMRWGLRYSEDGSEPPAEGWLPFVWPTLRRKIDQSALHYNAVCKKRSEAINKRWHPSDEKDENEPEMDASACTCIQMNANESKSMQNDTKHSKREEKREKSEEKGEKIEEIREIKKELPFGSSKEKTHLQLPQLDEVTEYFWQKGFDAGEAQRYFDYYTANGWKVGRNDMKDWRAAARNWMYNNPRPIFAF